MQYKNQIFTIAFTTVILIILVKIFTFGNNEYIEFKELPPKYNVTIDKYFDIKYPNPIKNENTLPNAIPSIVSNKTIYLTFDDGPSYLTNEILDILKEENVPATFFIVGRMVDGYADVVWRTYNDGHTVALHTHTHNYPYIYADDENYFNDLRDVSNTLYNITGKRSRILRLPGGSSNGISRQYNLGIMTRITNNLEINDYYYFDWNIDSGDASGKLTSEEIYNYTVGSLKFQHNIVLMHDTSTKKTTVEALRDIIWYGKENGYTFARITKDTPTTHHKVLN